jgi:hypothetical protein
MTCSLILFVMKKLIITSILLALFTTGATLIAQDRQEESLGLPGDNLNLYAVMKIFQESKTLEEFEKNLNDENSKINNLDLDGDNLVDYIRVIDFVDGDAHTIVLQDAVNEKENQDVAVFTVQRDKEGRVQIQLTGDESLYGKNYIIEPIFDEDVAGQTPNPGYIGNTRTFNGHNVIVSKTTTYEIANWPLVRFIYLPDYVGWRSSWYYGYYPSYWNPWHPYYWDYYYGYHYNYYNDYYAHYRRWDNHRYSRWNDYYWVDRRAHSPNVSVRIKEGNYRSTYSHPDQRREGEALYTKTHPSQNNRVSDRPTGNSPDRRTGSQSDGTSTNHRTNSSVTNRQATNPSSEKTTGATRRSNSTVSDRQTARPSSDKAAATTRRSPATVTNKSESKPPSVQNSGNSRSSGQSKSTGASSTSRRSNETSKPATTTKKTEKSKESEPVKPTRRK